MKSNGYEHACQKLKTYRVQRARCNSQATIDAVRATVSTNRVAQAFVGVCGQHWATFSRCGGAPLQIKIMHDYHKQHRNPATSHFKSSNGIRKRAKLAYLDVRGTHAMDASVSGQRDELVVRALLTVRWARNKLRTWGRSCWLHNKYVVRKINEACAGRKIAFT